jgi:hypothetical protein
VHVQTYLLKFGERAPQYFAYFLPILLYWIIFFRGFKKNEEVIWSVHVQTYLLKFGERAPQYFAYFWPICLYWIIFF